jgi:hypothetical protein
MSRIQYEGTRLWGEGGPYWRITTPNGREVGTITGSGRAWVAHHPLGETSKPWPALHMAVRCLAEQMGQ